MSDPMHDRQAFLALSETERREVIAEERRRARGYRPKPKGDPSRQGIWVPTHPRNETVTYSTPRVSVVSGGLPTLGKRR